MVVLMEPAVDGWDMQISMPVILPYILPKQSQHHQSRLPRQPPKQQQQPSRRGSLCVQSTPYSLHRAFGRQEGKRRVHHQIQGGVQRKLGRSTRLVTSPGPRDATASIRTCRGRRRRRRRSAAFVCLNLPAFSLLRPPLVEADVEDRVRGQVAQEDDQEGSNGVGGMPRGHGKMEAMQVLALAMLLRVPVSLASTAAPGL